MLMSVYEVERESTLEKRERRRWTRGEERVMLKFETRTITEAVSYTHLDVYKRQV